VNELSLFSGAGGGLLGTHLLGWKHIGYVEFNDYCQRVIAARIKDGILDNAPIFTDVCQFVQSGAAQQYRGFADVVTAGFPCQPFSVAGKRAGADDERPTQTLHQGVRMNDQTRYSRTGTTFRPVISVAALPPNNAVVSTSTTNDVSGWVMSAGSGCGKSATFIAVD